MIPNLILAVELRAARFGFAVLETPQQLQDFRASLFNSTGVARRRIARLLSLYQPHDTCAAGAGARYSGDMQSRRVISRIAKNEAKKLGIPWARISERVFKSLFGQYSCHDKYGVAAIVVRWFPELAPRVPPPLEFYDPEPRQMLYFDSIELGTVYLRIT